MIKKNIELAELLKIDDLFNHNGWEIEPDKEIRLSLYNKFVDRYQKFDYNTRDLFIDLSKRFLRIKENEVYPIFKEAYNTIYDEILDKPERIFILPLVNPYLKKNKSGKIPRPKVKSGEKIKVFIEVNDYYELKYSHKIYLPDNFDSFKAEFNKENDLLVLVDDFIGSGKTAIDILDEIFKSDNFSCDNTIVLSLVVQEEGVDRILEEKDVFTFYKILRKKCISDFYKNVDDINDVKEKVSSMENKIKCPEKWNLGYAKTEALVSIMNKSPNNTLPIFWYETKDMIAPFHRYIIYR